MNLIEVMVLAMGLRWSVRAEQRQDLQERQEAELLAAEATVRDAAAAAPRAGDCTAAARELEGALAAGGIGLGLSRPGHGEAVLVSVAGEDGQPDRQRLFHPAALLGLLASLGTVGTQRQLARMRVEAAIRLVATGIEAGRPAGN